MNLSFKTGLALAFGVAAAFGSTAQSEELEKVRFQLDWIPGGDKAAIYHGVELGLFKDAGIQVEMVPGRGAADAITKLSTGVSDVGIAGLGALMRAKAEGDVPVKAVFSIYSQQPDSLFVTDESGIDTIADLKGRTVGTATFSSSNAIWPILLELNGLRAEDVDVLSVDPGALAPMLATGRVDATVSWRTVSPIFQGALAEVGKELKMLPWSDFGLDGYGLSVMASETMIEERPEVLRAFVSAYVEAVAAANADPTAAAASLAEIETETDAELAAATYVASLPLIDNAVSQADGFGALTPDRLETTWKWVAQSQGYEMDRLDPMDVVDTSFLE